MRMAEYASWIGPLCFAVFVFMSSVIFYGGVNLGRINTTLDSLKSTFAKVQERYDEQVPLCNQHMDGIEKLVHNEAAATRHSVEGLSVRTDAAFGCVHEKLNRLDHRITRVESRDKDFKTPIPEMELGG